MRVPRLILVSSLIAICIAPAAAQSGRETSPWISSHGTLPTQSPILDGQQSLAPANPELKLVFPNQADNPFRSEQPRFNPDWQRQFKIEIPSDLPAHLDDAGTCYAIRSYRVKRNDPQSDSTTIAGYATCQPATRFSLKNATGTTESASP
jgi:hypothetical protein